MRAILIDDEPKNTRILTKLLIDYCSEIEIVGDANNTKAAFEIINTEHPDIIFLDIEMPNGNAFDLLDKLTPFTFQIIFITAFENYSLKAIKYSALDYILKPVNIGELQNAVKKALKNFKNRDIDFQIKTLLQNLNQSNINIQKVAIQTMEGLEFVKMEDIVRIRAEGNYSIFYLKNNTSMIASKYIKEYEDILPTDIFYRVHHSHIININFIKKYFKGRGGYLQLDDGTTIEVSTRRKNDFLSKFE